MGLPRSLAPKLINFSQVEREMEAEHTAGGSFLNSSSWASQATAWNSGHRASPRSAHTRSVAPPGPQPCERRPDTGCAAPSGLDRTGQPTGAWPGVTARLPK